MTFIAVSCRNLTTTSPTTLLWTIVFLLFCFHGAEAEVASSVSAMTSLIAQEGKLIEHLGKVLQLARIKGENATWISRIKRCMECIEFKHRSIAKAARNLAHPIIGFRLVRRLAQEWNDVTGIMSETQSHVDNAHALYDNLKAMRDVISKWTRWPTFQDVKDTAMGLIRIGSTYDLYPGTLRLDRATIKHGHRSEDDLDLNYFLLSSSAGRNMFYRFKNDLINNQSPEENISDSVRDKHNWEDDCDNVNPNDVKSNTDNNNNDDDDDNNDNNNKDDDDDDIKSSKKYDTMSESNTHVHIDTRTNNGKMNDMNYVKGEQACYYSYTNLDFKDFLYIINVAINQKLKDEAERWLGYLESRLGPRNDNWGDIGHHTMDRIKRKIKAINNTGKRSDSIMDNYVKLCGETLEVSSLQPVLPSPVLRCFWRQTFPYLRYKVELLHTSPDIYQFHDVISPREIEHIKDKAKEKLSPSALDIHDKVKGEARYWRVSQTAWLRDETPVLQRLSERVGHLTGLDTGIVTDTKGHPENIYSEPLQVVNYGLGGLYGPHLDTLHSTNHQSGTSGQQHKGDRLATWMFYLGDVHVGGATVFPRIDVSVRPIKGSAILWYNLLRNGRVDMTTVHAGCPVVIGDKWVANKWVLDTAQWKTRPCLLDPSL